MRGGAGRGGSSSAGKHTGVVATVRTSVRTGAELSRTETEGAAVGGWEKGKGQWGQWVLSCRHYPRDKCVQPLLPARIPPMYSVLSAMLCASLAWRGVAWHGICRVDVHRHAPCGVAINVNSSAAAPMSVLVRHGLTDPGGVAVGLKRGVAGLGGCDRMSRGCTPRSGAQRAQPMNHSVCPQRRRNVKTQWSTK